MVVSYLEAEKGWCKLRGRREGSCAKPSADPFLISALTFRARWPSLCPSRHLTLLTTCGAVDNPPPAETSLKKPGRPIQMLGITSVRFDVV